MRSFGLSLIIAVFLGGSRLLLPAQSEGKPQEVEALKLLQEKVVAREKSEAKSNGSELLGADARLTLEEIETLYLDGKITARQFQDYANKLRAEPTNPFPAKRSPTPAPTPTATPTPKPPTAPAVPNSAPPASGPTSPAVGAPPPMPPPKGWPTRAPVPPVAPATVVSDAHTDALEVLRQTKPDPTINPKPGPAIRSDQISLLGKEGAEQEALKLTPGSLSQEGFDEIEAKMDELLRLKEAREKSSATNAAPETIEVESAPRTPGTKRERLNDLLRLRIQGKLGEEEYNAKRIEIIKEPEGK